MHRQRTNSNDKGLLGSTAPIGSRHRMGFDRNGERVRRGGLVAFARDTIEADTAPTASELQGLLTEDELLAIEANFKDGISAVQIVEVFARRGVKLSEASFRKYVQQGLLPRSRRVGRKGKHRGSMGVYPAKTVRRINAVKQWMARGYTIEEIQEQFLLYTDLVEGVTEGLDELWGRLEAGVAEVRSESDRRALARNLVEIKREGDALVRRLEELAARVASPRAEQVRVSGAAGSAEDLL